MLFVFDLLVDGLMRRVEYTAISHLEAATYIQTTYPLAQTMQCKIVLPAQSKKGTT